MNKYFILFVLLLASVVAKAQDNTIYLGDVTGQVGGTVSVPVYFKADRISNMYQFDLQLPEGVKATAVGVEGQTASLAGFILSPNFEIPRFIANHPTNQRNEAGVYCLGNIVLTIDPTVDIAEYQIPLVGGIIVSDEGHVENIESSSKLNVRRAVNVTPMGEGYAVSIIPTDIEDGDNTLAISYKSAKGIKTLSFDVELPNGMYFIDDEEWDPANVESELTASTTGTPTFSHTLGAGDFPTKATITMSGAYTSKSKKYVNASETLASFCTISADVLTQDDVDEFGWAEDVISKGINNIKISNIVLIDIDGDTHTGEYIGSVFFGKTDDADPIAYGTYTDEALAALVSATQNVATLDISAATVEGKTEEQVSAEFNDILVYGPAKTCYTRNVKAGQQWGTICVPYELASDETVQYYTLKSADATSVVIQPVETLAANQPAFFIVAEAGTKLAASAEGYCFAKTAGMGEATDNLQLVGTYAKTTITSGEGYYLSAGKLYNDGATIRPFKAYLKAITPGARVLDVLLDGETGIHTIGQYDVESGEVYNLSGVKISQPQRGVNIIGGKKVIFK